MFLPFTSSLHGPCLADPPLRLANRVAKLLRRAQRRNEGTAAERLVAHQTRGLALGQRLVRGVRGILDMAASPAMSLRREQVSRSETAFSWGYALAVI